MGFPVRNRTRLVSITTALGLALALGCSDTRTPDVGAGFSYKDLPTSTGSAEAGEGKTVTMQGRPLTLAGEAIQVGDSLRDVTLAGRNLAPVSLTESSGKVRILSIVPSLDTAVCEQQTHYLSERVGDLGDQVELVTISIDTPFAQSRFAREAEIENVTFLSDYREAAFGRTHGLLVEGPHFLARTVMVVDPQNVIRYIQVNPELASMPDMEEAFRFARSLVADGADQSS